MAEQWCPFAVRWPGPPERVGYGSNVEHPKRGFVVHSAEGYHHKDGSDYTFIDEMWAPGRQASWHFSVVRTPPYVYQHYPLDVNAWHAGDADDDGGVRANIELGGMETEGVVGEGLTPEQRGYQYRVIKWAAEARDWPGLTKYWPTVPSTWDAVGLLAEHRHVSDRYTTCPNDRIPFGAYIKQWEGETMPTDEEIELFVLRVERALYQAIVERRYTDADNILRKYFGVNPP